MKKLMTLLTALFVAVMLLPSVAKAEDTRQVITEVNLTMDELAPRFGETLQKATITVPTNAVYKTDGDQWEWEDVDGVFRTAIYENTFTPGTWLYAFKVRIEGENAKSWRLPYEAADLTVKVNGVEWRVAMPSVNDTRSLTWVYSPKFTISDEGVALGFYNPKNTYGTMSVPRNFKGTPINEIRVCDYTYGGTKPYVFSKVSGPSWITVNSSGVISGTPIAFGTNERLVVRITDALGAVKDVDMYVSETICAPEDREVITEIVATTSSLQLYAGDLTKNLTFSLPEGSHYEVNNSGWLRKQENGSWTQVGEDDLFVVGVYKYYANIRIDERYDGKYYRFPSKGETPDRPTAKINGVTWEVSNTTVQDTFSYVNIYSPEIQVISVTTLSEVHLQGTLPVPVPGEPIPAVSGIAVSEEDASKYAIMNAYWERNSDHERFYNGGEIVTPNDTYYLCVYLQPKKGYIFEEKDGGISFYDGSGDLIMTAPLTSYAGSMVPGFTKVYSVGNIKITSVSLESLTLPYHGNAANADAVVSAADATRYEIVSQKWSTNSSGTGTVDMFVKGTTYYYRATLRAKDGHAFPTMPSQGNMPASMLPASINRDSDCIYSRFWVANGDVMITARFVADGTTINYSGDVMVSGITIPAAGAFLTAAEVPEGACYQITGLTWSEMENFSTLVGTCNIGDMYAPNSLYACTFNVVPTAPYVFVGNGSEWPGTIKINGEAAKKIDYDHIGSIMSDEALFMEYLTGSWLYGYSSSGDGMITLTRYFRTGDELKDAGLALNNVNVVLQNNLALQFFSPMSAYDEGGYGKPYIVFNVNGKEKTVQATEDGTNYVFICNNIAPQMIGDRIGFTIYAMKGTQRVKGMSASYSVKDYCDYVLQYMSSDVKLRTLIVDLLNYGAATQTYANYKTDALVNKDLTTMQQGWATDEERDYVYSAALTNVDAADLAGVSITNMSLVLNETVAIRYFFTADSISGLTLEIKDDKEQTWTLGESDFVKGSDNNYHVDFRKLQAKRMSDVVYATFHKGSQKSYTAVYSIESYASIIPQYTTDQKLLNLISCMMKYGDAAKAYATP